MIRLVRAELLKVTSTRLVFWLALVVVVLAGIGVAGTTLAPRQADGIQLQSAEGIRAVFGSAGSGQLLALVMGVIAMSGEWRHRTATSTFLAMPRRGRVVSAKVIAHVIIGLGYGLVAVLVTVLTAAITLSIKHVDYSLTGDRVPAVLSGAVLATMVYAVLGVGYGALVRNQVAAIVSALLWVTLADALLVALLPKVGRWTPGGASQALAQVATAKSDNLPVWGAALVLAGYGVAFAWIGLRTAVSRDIT